MSGAPRVVLPSPIHSAMGYMRHDYQNSAAAQNQAYAAQQAAMQQALNPYCNFYQNSPPPMLPGLSGLRTEEEIKEQLEARYASLEKMAADAKRDATYACKLCGHRRGDKCHNALVKGFGEAQRVWDNYQPYSSENPLYLCGAEKALWLPRRSILKRLIDWFIEPWLEERAEQHTTHRENA